jgi:hypothetical protein
MSDIVNPMDSFKSAFEVGNTIQQQQQAAAARALAAQQAAAAAAHQAELMAIVKKLQEPGATYDDYMKASILMPKDQADAIQKAAAAMKTEEQQAVLTDSSHVFAALQAGRNDVATDLLTKQAEATRAAGNEQGAKFAESLVSMINQDPVGAKAVSNLIGYQMAVLPGGKDAIDAINKVQQAQGTNPDVTKQQQIDTDLLTQAQTAEAWANAWRLKHPNTPGSNQPAEKLMNDAVDNVGAAAAAANEALNLANAIDKAKPANGWPVGAVGWASEAVKKAFGGEDVITALKTEYTKIRNYEALKHLPPGAASDKDVEIALGAFPDVNAGPGYIASFMRGIAKLQSYTANYNKVKAQWVDHVGSLGSAKEAFDIEGVGTVKPGMNFWSATDKLTMPNVNAGGTTSGQNFSIQAGGKTYTFPDQASLDAFKKEAGL